jgi:hypothetical protein
LFVRVRFLSPPPTASGYHGFSRSANGKMVF